VLGLESAGVNPLDLGSGAHTPIGYLRSEVRTITSTGDLERTILALDAAGVNPHHFAGRDLVAKLQGRRGSNGSFQGQVNLTAFGILALRSAGVPASGLGSSAGWLEHAQGKDGGWGFQSGIASDPDSTGAAMQGIAAASPGAGALEDGVRYLQNDQNRDGGWPLAGSGPSNTQSTAWAIQGLIAAGVSPGSIQTNKHSGGDYLRARQAADGHYRYSSSSDQTPVWVTGQALQAAQGRAFPLAAVPRAPHRSAAGGGHHSGGGTSSGGTSAGGEGGSDTTSTTTPSSGNSGGGTWPGYLGAGGGLPRGGLGGGGGGNAPAHGGGGDPGRSAPAAEDRRLFADVAVPKANAPDPAPAAGDGDSHTRRDILIGAGAIVLLAGAWFGYRRLA
jgi:hypothetical protein